MTVQDQWYTPPPPLLHPEMEPWEGVSRSLESITESLEVLAGIRGDGGQTLITASDLLNEEFIASLAANPSSILNYTPAYGLVSWGDVPPPPTNIHRVVHANDGIAAPWYHHIEWTNPVDQSNVYFIEVWSSTIENINTAKKVAIVTPPANSVMIYGVLLSVDYYYWIRSVSFGYKHSTWEPNPDTVGGYMFVGEETISETIDNIIDLLTGETPPAWESTITYSIGDTVAYTVGSPATTRKYRAVAESLNEIPWEIVDGNAVLNDTYWERIGILMQGDVDGSAVVGIDGHLVVDGSIIARHIAADIIEGAHIAAGEIVVAHIGDTTELLNENQVWGEVASRPSTSAANLDEAADRALAAINASDIVIAKCIPESNVAPSGAGLYLGADYMGYYDSSNWKTYMDSSGNFYLGGTSGALTWNGSTLAIEGNVVIGSGNDLTVESGGDIHMETTSGNNSNIFFYGDERTYTMGANYTSGIFTLFTDTDDEGWVAIGVDYSGSGFARPKYFEAAASSSAKLAISDPVDDYSALYIARYSSTWEYAYSLCRADGPNGAQCQVDVRAYDADEEGEQVWIMADLVRPYYTYSTKATNFGDAYAYWADISYKTLTDRGCLGWFDDGVELQDGSIVSDIEAIKSIEKHPTKLTTYGAPALDYKTMPKVVYKPAADAKHGTLHQRDENDEPYIIDEHGQKQHSADGAETTALLSIMLGALKEIDLRLKKLET